MYHKKYAISISSFLIVIFFLVACIRNEEKLYYDNGQLKASSPVKDGKWHGRAYFYYENGNLSSQCQFENGLRQGEGIFYYQNGTIKQSVFYHNDTIMKSATFRADGTLEIIKEYDDLGRLIEYTCYIDSGKIDSDASKRFPIFVTNHDTLNQGEIYKAEVRLGNRYYNSIYVFLGDTTDPEFYLRPHLERIYKEVSILEIDTDTCKLGKNFVYGIIFETCDTCQGYGWATKFKHEFYVLPAGNSPEYQ